MSSTPKNVVLEFVESLCASRLRFALDYRRMELRGNWLRSGPLVGGYASGAPWRLQPSVRGTLLEQGPAIEGVVDSTPFRVIFDETSFRGNLGGDQEWAWTPLETSAGRLFVESRSFVRYQLACCSLSLVVAVASILVDHKAWNLATSVFHAVTHASFVAAHRCTDPRPKSTYERGMFLMLSAFLCFYYSHVAASRVCFAAANCIFVLGALAFATATWPLRDEGGAALFLGAVWLLAGGVVGCIDAIASLYHGASINLRRIAGHTLVALGRLSFVAGSTPPAVSRTTTKVAPSSSSFPPSPSKDVQENHGEQGPPDCVGDDSSATTTTTSSPPPASVLYLERPLWSPTLRLPPLTRLG